MGKEIERKFLVYKEQWKKVRPKNGVLILQGYFLKSLDLTIRVRIKGEQGFLTIKGRTQGISRDEFEYEIPKEEALKLLRTYCEKWIEKYRFAIKVGNHLWEVDEFVTPFPNLILAEIELKSEEEDFERPDWIEGEVSDDPRYYNANML